MVVGVWSPTTHVHVRPPPFPVQAAESGSADGMYNAGMLYKDGIGAPKDVAKAAGYLVRAAQAGHVRAALVMGLAYSTPGAWLDQYDAHLFHEYVRRHTPSTAADEPGGTAVPATEAMGGGASAGSGSAGGAPGTAHPDASHSTSDLPTALEDRRGPSGVGTSADSNISGDDDDDWLFSRPAAPSFPRQPRLVSATLQVRRHNHTAHQRELSIEVQRRGQGTQKRRYPLHLSCSHATEFLWKAAQVRCPEVRALHMYHVGEHAWTCVITRSRDCCRQRWRQHATPPRAGMSCNLASAWHMWCRLGTGDPRCGLRWTGVVIAACRP